MLLVQNYSGLDWTKNKWKRSQCSKKDLHKTWRTIAQICFRELWESLFRDRGPQKDQAVDPGLQSNWAATRCAGIIPIHGPPFSLSNGYAANKCCQKPQRSCDLYPCGSKLFGNIKWIYTIWGRWLYIWIFSMMCVFSHRFNDLAHTNTFKYLSQHLPDIRKLMTF